MILRIRPDINLKQKNADGIIGKKIRCKKPDFLHRIYIYQLNAEFAVRLRIF